MIRNCIAVLAFSFVVMLPVPGFSREMVTLNELIDSARQNNPDIKSAEKAYRSADYGIASMSAWSDPWIGVDYMAGNNRLMITQMFSFPGKRSYKRNAASAMAHAEYQQFKQKTLELDTKVKKAFWGYWLADMNKDIYNENLTLMRRFLETAKSQYVVGKVTEADVLAATAELGRMKGMLLMAQYESDAMRSELNGLMDKGPDEALGTPQKPEVVDAAIDYALLEEKALAGNFGLAEKKYLYQSSLADASSAKMEWFPDLMADVRLSTIADNSEYMATVRLPLYFWNRTSEAKSKRSLAEAAEQNLESEKNNIRQALKNMYLQYARDVAMVKLYESDIMPSARQAVQVSESAYRVGKVDFQYLLDLQKKYLDFEIEYNKLTAESRMYYAELEMIAGGPLK